jgi:sulfide:quinone oxidoreductase
MRVLVAGGGIAALETLAALRDLGGDRVELTLLAPDDSFSYRPLSTAVPFTFRGERKRALADLTGGLGARHIRDGLAQVDGERRRVLTRGGDLLPYDSLVVAVGARPARPGVGDGWFRGARGTALMAEVLRELEAGRAQRVAFVVPDRAAWPVDAYELALVAALAAEKAAPERRSFS